MNQLIQDPVAARDYVSQLSVGGVSLRVAGQRKINFASLLQPFHVSPSHVDIAVQVEWLPRLLPQHLSPAFDSGRTWRLYESGPTLQFDFYSPAVGDGPYKRLITDATFRKATLQLSDECTMRLGRLIDPLGYPVDELLIMHRLTQEKAIELHSTGIVRPNGDANLFVGHSGAGKSTTTRLWTSFEDVEILSDDRIIVRRDDGATNETHLPDAEPKSVGILRLHEQSALPIAHSAQNDKAKSKMRMYGTPWHGEAMYASPNSAPLSRIFVLEHGHGNVVTPLTPSQAVAELFARSFVPFHRHEYVESALAFLEEVAESVPVYRYDFEPDERAVEKIIHFHD
jgi:hypothetical protein